MRVLHTIHSLNPLHGGTSYGLRGMVDGLLAKGVDTEILVLDDETSPWLADWPCKVHAAGRGIGYYGFNWKFDNLLARIVMDFDQVVVHGLWQYHGVATRSACLNARVSYVVFPHGMLDQWFSQAYLWKHLVKQVYWWLAESRLLRDAAAVFFTTLEEFEAGRNTFFPFAVRPAIAAFGIQPPHHVGEGYSADFRRPLPESSGLRTLLFLGRIHPKKGCDLLIEGFARWHSSLPAEKQNGWHLKIVGPSVSEAYLKQLRDLAGNHQLVERGLISFIGNVNGGAKWHEIKQADALILPSHQENFGVIIAEAMACGVPVLISNKVNGWRAIQEAGAGFAEPDTVEGVISLIQHWEELSLDTVAVMRRGAYQYFATHMSADVGVRAFLDTVQVLGKVGLPQRYSTLVEAETHARRESPLKVLHVCSSLSSYSGGPSFALPLIASGLAHNGVKVDVVTTDDDGPGMRLRGVVLGEPMPQGDYNVIFFPKQSELYRFSWPMACWLLRNAGEYDLIHIHGLFSFPSLASAVAACCSLRPYAIRPLGVLNRWGMQSHRPLLKKISLMLIEKPMLEGACFVHYTSDAEAEQANALGFTAHWIVMPLGIDPANYERLPSKQVFYSVFPQAAACKFMLFLSRVDSKKGLDLLIDAMPEIIVRHPEVLLVIVGHGNVDFINSLKSRAEKNGVSGKIVWCGFLSGDVKLSAFRSARLFVLPSYSENFGLALLEAMACGVACVASREVGLAQENEARDVMDICETTVESLTSSICRLLSDESLCESLGARARALALKHYSVNTMTLRLSRVYQLVTKKQIISALPHK